MLFGSFVICLLSCDILNTEVKTVKGSVYEQRSLFVFVLLKERFDQETVTSD